MKPFTTYKQAMSFLFEQLPMFQRVGPKALKFDLSNITRLMDALGNPQEGLTCIHVAGTNGKGSVCHYMASILQEAGYNVGLYTSPHYRDYRERIRYNGQLIEKQYVVKFLNRLISEDILTRLSPSFFEIGVAMAFCYFEDIQVDFAVIETGLGGRLDSTNIITPILSIITTIDYDHQATLGETLPLIAQEKAGIIKSNIPVVIGHRQVETEQVFKSKAQSLNAHIVFAEDVDPKIDFPSLSKIKYQQQNMHTASIALGILDRPNVSLHHQKVGIQNVSINTGYMGRWQTLSTRPHIIADAAHNQQGLSQLLVNLSTVSYCHLHVVLGMVSDKPITEALSLLPNEAKYYFAKANIPRGKSEKALKQEANTLGLEGKSYKSIRKALAAAKLSARENDLILVTGSIFTVAEVV